MKINITIATLLIVGVALTACDDTTGTIGTDMMPSEDRVTNRYETYDILTNSYEVGDSVLARSSVSYLGQYTDSETGTIVKSDFLSQFHCSEGFSFPDSVVGNKVTNVEIRLYIEDYVGDSLATFKLSVYPLNRVLDANKNYYTNINPADYYDKSQKPITTKWFSISDRTISDSARWSSSYTKSIRVSLPIEIGQQIYNGYREHPEYFKNSETFLHSGLPGSKGFYFKIESGDGAMAYIDISQFNIYFNYYDAEYKKDTLGVCQFAGTEEVVQATRFENKRLVPLLTDTRATYLKSPAGVFTEATLPVEQIEVNDTINSASVAFVRYNDRLDGQFKLNIPQTVLMVRLDDYKNGFFENYQLTDETTSYLASFNSSTNSYEFTNIAKLMAAIKREYANGTASPNANKVLLIPVKCTYDKSNQLIRLTHDFSMSSVRLRNDAQMKVIYSSFNKSK